VLVIFLRTAIDYGVNCSFYFPPQDPVTSAVSPSAQTVTVANTNRRIYFAAPLFTQAEWQWNNRLSAELAKLNFEVILPQRSAEPMLQGSRPFNASALFSLNREEIDRADLVLAVLDEADADSGTSWECGYAYKSGRPILGLRTDIRRTGDDPNASVNLMLSQSCKQLIQVPLQRINDLSWVAQKIADSANAILR